MSSIMKGLVDETETAKGVITSHDANDPEVAILGGAGTMSLSRLKKKAHAEALQLADDIANGKYNASSYNMKQLHNTLDTIVAAEKEMEKSYFGENDINEYREVTPSLRAAQQNLLALRNKEKTVSVPGKRERVARDKVELDKPKQAAILARGGQEIDPDTMDAIAAFLAKGGEIKKGRAGKAPPVGRNQASKHIGGGGQYRKKSDTPGQGANYRGEKIVAVEDEQLDEKCWKDYKQVGMKKKGDKTVPNCVKKESAIMKGFKQ